MADKEVKVKISTDVDMEKVESLESKIKELQHQKIREKIEVDTAELNTVENRIKELEKQLASPKEFKLNDEQIKKAESELQTLKEQRVDLEIAVNTSKLQEAKAEIEELDNETIDIDANMSMQNIAQGITQAKQGLMDLKANMDEVSQAGLQSEQNMAFLEMNLGADKAKQTYQDISDIVASMPGDDNTMRSVLSTAQALGNNLNPDEMKAAAGTMADYMSGSATMGKQALESQQDIMKYLLDGNTAELERGSIVSSQVDKLKEATTFQERQAAMQEVLNQLGYGGISQQDTMLNKQAEWEGMLYNSKDALSSMWLGAEKGAMDYILKLNDASNGLVGMGLVAGQMVAGPLVDVTTGLGQMATGMKAIKDLNMIKWLKDLEIMTKLSAAADWLLSGAQAVLNAVMSLNPIVLVVLALVALAAALIWAYYNVDWFREMVDNAWASLVQIGQVIYGYVMGAIQWLSDMFTNFTSQLGLNTSNWIQSILGFILFIPTLPLQVGIALANTLAKALGFGNNFVQRMVSAGSNAVSGFVSYITSLPGIVMGEFERVLGLVNEFINTLPDRVWDMGAAIIDALKKSLGIGSPGHMFYMIEGEFKRIDDLTEKTSFDTGSIGQQMVDNFNPDFQTGNASIAQASSNNITINIDNVDNEERIQQIVKAVEDALKFDNVTAGRSV